MHSQSKTKYQHYGKGEDRLFLLLLPDLQEMISQLTASSNSQGGVREQHALGCRGTDHPSPTVRHLDSSNTRSQIHLEGFKTLLTLTLPNKPWSSDTTCHGSFCFHRHLAWKKSCLHAPFEVQNAINKQKNGKKYKIILPFQGSTQRHG